MMLDQTTRVTPKFRDSTNFNNVLGFLFECDETSIDNILEMSDMQSSVSLILDKIGELLGVFPRPLIEDDGHEVRQLSDEEYGKFLKAIAAGGDFDGTVNQWEELFYRAVLAESLFVNRESEFGIIIRRALTTAEKRILELLVEHNILTVSMYFIGTTEPTDTLWRLDIDELDSAGFANPW